MKAGVILFLSHRHIEQHFTISSFSQCDIWSWTVCVCACEKERVRMKCCVYYQQGSGELHHCALITATFVWKVAAVNLGTRLQRLNYHMSTHTHTHARSHTQIHSGYVALISRGQYPLNAWSCYCSSLFWIAISFRHCLWLCVMLFFCGACDSGPLYTPKQTAYSVVSMSWDSWNRCWPCCDSMYQKCPRTWSDIWNH